MNIFKETTLKGMMLVDLRASVFPPPSQGSDGFPGTVGSEGEKGKKVGPSNESNGID